MQLPPQAEPSEVHWERLPRGCCPAGTVEQVPRDPARLQAWHCPVQVELQQTPSTQVPEAHWSEAEQATPFAPWGTQAPELHQ